MLLDDVLDTAARRAPDGIALVTAAGATTFAELGDRVARVAAGITARTNRGDRVAILAENRAEYVECYYAVPRAGRVLVPLNHRLHAEEWAATLGRAGARVLIAEPALLERLGVGAARAAGVETVVGLDTGAADPAELAYETLLDAEPVAPASGRAPDDVVWLLGTSGTTGRPKLAMLTHASLLAAADATATARPVLPDDVLLTPFPLCHVAGYNVFVLHRHACPVVLMRRFDPAQLAALVRAHCVTQLSLAPTMIAMLLDDASLNVADLATVRAIGYGASPIPAPVLRRAVERLGCDLSQGYGMTELSGNAVFLDADAHRAAADGNDRLLHAAGRAAPGVEVRVDAPEADGVGEIVVRGRQVMAGYWRDPDATSQALRDGWLHTGDVGRLDPDGLLSIVDRKKDVIVSGGENIASREVEELLHSHPGVRDVAVIGLPDERWGERVCAVVVPRDGVTVAADELVALSRAHLAGFKTPREIVFASELPRNAAGKVLKQVLREELGAASTERAE